MIKIEKKIAGYSVRKPSDATPPAESPATGEFINDADRRLAIAGVPTPVAASLRWEKRPVTPEGNPSWTYTVDSPEGRFWIIVGHVQNGTQYPFEVFVNGAPPRGLVALAMSLSIDLRSRDRAYLRTKLEALAKTQGEAFDGLMPDGTLMRFPSAVAAFARVVMWHCDKLGAFDQHPDYTPVRDALMSRKEPKTTPDGTLSWSVDVKNPATDDDFLLILKEATLPDGQRRPISLWLSGDYPKSLDGLCKSLSKDMQVVEPDWVGRKLRQLVDHDEPRAEFMALEPGTEKGKMYPSTVAYIARLIIHRFAMLGLLNEDGSAVKDNGVVQLSLIEGGMKPAEKIATPMGATGKHCTDCGAYAVQKVDGCDTCRSCGASKCG